MFRIYSFASRSAVRRSPTTLRCLRTFHYTPIPREKADNLYSELLADLQNNHDHLVEKVPRKRSTRSKLSKSPSPNRNEKPEKPKDDTERVEQATSAPKPKRARGKGKNNLTAEQKRVGRAERKANKAIQSRKIPPALLENPWKDVNKYLSVGYGGTAGRLPLGDNKRIHVISEALCDDALERLEPTLEKHVGCDIIDINPGTCLWSSKLHNRLKPRTHILLEPDDKLYKPFLAPLLDAPGSTYKLVPKSGIVWGHLETVLSKEYLPFQESYQRGDPRLEKRNDTLLVVANLGYHPRKSYRGFDSLATLVLHQFMSAMRSHSLFQQYGHVRVMVWASDEERRHLLPREIHQRRKTSVEAELSCEHISEIASSTQEIGRFRRAKFLDMEKGREVLRKMEVAGIRTPKGRESVVLNELLQEGEGDKFPREDDPASVYMFSEELERLEAAFAAGEFTTYEDEAATQSSSIPRRGPLSKVTLTPEFKRLRYLRYRKTSKDKKEDRWSALAEQFDSIIALQKDIHFAKASGADTHAQELELQQRTQFWQDDIVDKLPDQEMAQLLYLLDNRRTYSNNPPLLVWDRRNFEPLRVRPEEFFPHKEMCLLDFHPRSLWPILRKDLRNNYDILEFILSSIFILPTQPIKRALSSLWPGAYDWIVAECPSLTDPSKGGTLDLDMMTVRCMTEDMLKEIVEAWVRWPFRPTRYELLSRMGSTAHNADELDISE